MAQDDDLYDAYNVPEFFTEGLGRIEQVGPCRRLIFFTKEHGGRGRAPVVRLVLAAEALADIAQMIAADVHMPNTALASIPADALAN